MQDDVYTRDATNSPKGITFVGRGPSNYFLGLAFHTPDRGGNLRFLPWIELTGRCAMGKIAGENAVVSLCNFLWLGARGIMAILYLCIIGVQHMVR